MGFVTDLQGLFKTVSSQENSFIPGGSTGGTKRIKSIFFQVAGQAESPQKRGRMLRRALIDCHRSSAWRGDCALEFTCVRAMTFSPQKGGISGLISFQVDDGV